MASKKDAGDYPQVYRLLLSCSIVSLMFVFDALFGKRTGTA